MRVVVLLVVLLAPANALFGFFEKKPDPVVQTPRDSGDLGQADNVNLGRKVQIPDNHEASDDGAKVDIPLNHPSTRRDFTRPIVSTTPRPSVSKVLPSNDRHPSKNCPTRIDAYTFAPDSDLLFSEDVVYSVRDGRILSTDPISQTFPGGPRKVNGAVYDKEREILLLLDGRSAYGFKKHNGEYKLESQYPKELPSSIAFTPEAAIRWHDNHQMLLSNGGMFALYDEYWNKSLMTGRTSQYFEHLPDRVRGMGDWRGGRADLFTQSLVFIYDSATKNVVGDGKSLPEHLHC